MALYLLKTTRVRATLPRALENLEPAYSGHAIRALSDEDYAGLLREVARDAARRNLDTDLTLSDLAAV